MYIYIYIYIYIYMNIYLPYGLVYNEVESTHSYKHKQICLRVYYFLCISCIVERINVHHRNRIIYY